MYEGWMVRIGRRKIGRSFIHMRYFVLEPGLLAYYKRNPQDNQVPVKTLVIDGNCRVEDQGLKTHHGHMVYVLSMYSKKEKNHRISVCLILSFVFNLYFVIQRLSAQEDAGNLLRRRTIGRGPPESIWDWTREIDSDLSQSTTNQAFFNQAFFRKHWRLLQCQNGLLIFEELSEVDYLVCQCLLSVLQWFLFLCFLSHEIFILQPRSCSRAMKAVGVVEASCEDIFKLVISMDGTWFEWDCSFQYGSLVEEVDGHTAVIYHRLLLDWFPMVVWPRDLCYVRYWRRNDDLYCFAPGSMRTVVHSQDLYGPILKVVGSTFLL